MARLHLTRTGGLAGIAMEATVDTGELDPATADRILAAVRRADVSKQGAAPGLPDAFSYELEIDDGHSTRRMTFSDPEAPESLQPALDVLRPRMRPRRR
jgi:hypothetical protein